LTLSLQIISSFGESTVLTFGGSEQVRRECFKERDSGHDAGSQECQLKRVILAIYLVLFVILHLCFGDRKQWSKMFFCVLPIVTFI